MRSGILLVILLFISPTFAQDAELSIGMRPSNSPEPVLSEEIWERLETEHFSIPVEVSRLDIDAQVAMRVLAPNLPELDQCVGNVPAQPTFTIQWDRMALDEVLPMAFYMQGSQNTTMIVREPDGDWHCSDDFGATTHPYVRIDSLRSGAYEIWIGSTSEISGFTGLLYITTGNDTPANAPRPCCDGLIFSNPAQGATEATITYFEVDPLDEADPTESGIALSTDIIFRGDGGTTFTIELRAFDRATGDPIPLSTVQNSANECETSIYPCDVERIRRDTSRRDYGSRRGPVNFDLETLDYAGLGSDYYIDVVVTAYPEGANPEVVDSIRIQTRSANGR